ncbi:glycosyltransferase [Aequorivita marisscotiae]|uniref:Glycosyltransferase n=1 Tax=Aequorivita marisscotiae TaxID=3040348 RepID=A0ABY8KYE9_9FLAO|nr:glycosyltransferase [Aequorivita sp. Ant34-E75]WGF92742.1 glycosyltransferase [Aequorivita sp. Ant34-E75]
MREGQNIARDQLVDKTSYNHRVIVPLYIPNNQGYYKDAFSIFEICLKSVNKTASSNIAVSVVSNGSSNAVNDALLRLYKEGLINELIIEKEQIGKLNCILKVLRTSDERFLTITDADILFMNDWESEIMKVFETFPKAAAVSPIPVFRTQNHYTSNIIFDFYFSNKIKFSKVQNPEALTKFAKSIGWEWLDEKWKDVIMTLDAPNGDLKAVVGCNHCTVTYKREIFESIPNCNSKYKLGGDSEGVYLDKPSMFYDGYRLATYDSYAYHLGNKLEDWMIDSFNDLKESDKIDFTINAPILKKSILKHIVKNVVFKKIMARKPMRKWYYLRKGLNKNKVTDFV